MYVCIIEHIVKKYKMQLIIQLFKFRVHVYSICALLKIYHSNLCNKGGYSPQDFNVICMYMYVHM